MKIKKFLFMLGIIFSMSMVIPTMDVKAETVDDYHYDENLGVYVIDSPCVLIGKTLYGDVYISEDAVLSLFYSSIYGTVYVYGGMKFDSSSYVTNLVAGSMSWSSSNSFSRGEVKASGTISGGTNYKTIQLSIELENSLPMYIKDDLILSDGGKLKMAGSYANALQMSLEGYGEINVDSKGCFNISDIDIGDADTITLYWTWKDNPSYKITKELNVVKGTIDSDGNINFSPVINANDICLHVGEEYDFMKNVSAMDSEDGDISNNIIVDTSNLDINKRGTYTIKYYVEDSIGQKTEKNIQVKVIDPKVLSISFSEELVTKDCTTSSFELIPNVSVQDNPEYTIFWESDNEDVMTVNTDGCITILGVGSAVITAKINENNVATCKVNIIHVWDDDYTIDKEPTCIDNGTKSIHCVKCNTLKDDSIIDIKAKGHIIVKDLEQKATCLNNGLTEGSHCSVCGEIIKKQEEIPATGHIWNKGTVTQKATTTSEGIKTYTCTVCKALKTEAIPKLTTVDKKNQKISVSTSKKISVKSVKQKAQSFKLVARSTSGNKVKYKLVKSNKRIKLSALSGKITVKKGTKKGTYKIKVKMMVEGDEKYLPYSKTKTITIKVR